MPKGALMADMKRDTRPYITVTNELFRHPKFLRLSDAAKVHLLETWAYCNEYRTDGVIPVEQLNAKRSSVGKELLALGWAEATEDKFTYRMHDYLDHQKSAAEIEGHKAKKAAWGKWGAHQRYHKTEIDPSCSHCNGEPKPES